MNLSISAYLIILVVSAFFTLLLAVLLFRRLGRSSKWLGWNMVTTAWWAITYSCELLSERLSQMLFWVDLQYIGIALVPATWLFFIISFIGKQQWFTTRNILLIWSIPILTLLIVWTNEHHGLHYSSIVLDTVQSHKLLSVKHGIWYRFFTGYSYLCLGFGFYLLLTTFQNHGRLYRTQRNIILFATSIPWLTNLLYVAGFRPYSHIDLTPVAFLTSAIIISIGLLKYKLLDILPIAREKIVEAMREGVLVVDMYQRVIDTNEQMKKILGIKETQKIIGRKLTEVLPKEDKLQALIAEHRYEKIEVARRQITGDRLYEVEVNPLHERPTVYGGIIVLFRDVTDRKLAEQQLNQKSLELEGSNKLKDRLFSIIAHDLRSPIRNLKLLVNLSNNQMITDEEFKSLLPELAKKVGYVSDLLENLLYWSKNQLEGQGLEKVVFDLKTVSQNEIHYSAQKAQEKGIYISDNIPPNTTVFADVHMIELVVRNLLSNAIKFCSAGDRISILCEKSSWNELTVKIKDSGSGMSQDILEKIFLFETFTTRGTNNEQGTGLGLQLCKEFVEKNNGKIWAESESGKGATFYFTVPVKAKEAELATVSA
jgi:PAS domain S-box-containing protein